MILEPGMKVECVGGGDPVKRPKSNYPGIAFPAVGSVYTVREVIPYDWDDGCGVEIGIRLVEIVNPVRKWTNGTNEPAWRSTNFRPIRNRDTDISEFRKIVADVFKRVDA